MAYNNTTYSVLSCLESEYMIKYMYGPAVYGCIYLVHTPGAAINHNHVSCVTVRLTVVH